MLMKYFPRTKWLASRQTPSSRVQFSSAHRPSGLARFVVVAVFFLSAPLLVALTVTHQPTFAAVLCILIAILIALLPRQDALWRYFLLVAFIATMSGQLGKYFGHSLLSTFVIEDVLCLFLSIILLFSFLSKRHTRIHLPLPLLAVLAYGFTMICSTLLLLSRSEPDGLYKFWYHLLTSEYRRPIITAITAFTLAAFSYSQASTFPRILTLTRLLLAGSLLVSGLAISEYLLRDTYYRFYLTLFGSTDEVSLRIARALYFRRAFGTFSSGPTLAAWLVLFTPLALYGIFMSRNTYRRLYNLISILILTTGIFVTGSRAPLAALIAILFLYPWMLGNLKSALAATSLLSIALVLLILYGPNAARLLPENNLLERVFSPREGSITATLEKRQEVWVEAFEKFRDNPVFGVGPDQFRKLKLMREVPNPNRLDSAHSGYLQTLAELGYAGAMTGLLVIVSALVCGFIVVRRLTLGEYRGLAAALYCSIIALFVTGITEPAFTLNRNFYVFTICLGLLLRFHGLAQVHVGRPCSEERFRNLEQREDYLAVH